MSAFTFPGNLTELDYPAFLSQHDVVYLAPVPDGIDGFSLGNGDLGAMLWTPPDHLQLSINKVDLWDDGPDGPFSAWGEQDEEVSTMLRSAGSLTIGHGLPTFDRLYLTDFAGRLRLAEAQVDIQSATPFASVSTEAFASEAAGVLVLRYRDWTEEALPRRVELARWGTRSLLHWYRRLRRDDPLTLRATEAGTDGEHLWITQQLREMHFAMAACLDGPARPRRLHRRVGVFESDPVMNFEGTIYLAVVTSEEADDPLSAAIERVGAAARQGVASLREDHRRAWRHFWEASFVDLPPKQDYVENLWYLNSYHVASASRGRYPLNHINAIYSWNRDLRPWAHYYHWNEQIHVWPLHTIGHGELAMPYYRWRRGMLERAMEDARRIHDREGAFFSDVSNRKGYQAVQPEEGLGLNLTPGPQIAGDFWRHYAYTRDEAFLQEYAYPLIREVTRFYLDTVTQRGDGRYTFVGTQPYESGLLLRDTLTDLAHARQLFQVFLEASALLHEDHELRDRCREVVDKLADYVTLPVSTESEADPNSIADMRPVLFKEVQPGDPTMPMWFVGYKVPEGSAVAADRLPDGAPVHEGMSDPVAGLWIFTSTTMAPIFPANQVGLDQAGTPEFETAVNTVKALGYDHQGFSLWIVAKARLGLANELRTSLENWPQLFQIFPQGFSHWAMSNHPDMDLDSRYLKPISVVDSPGETIYWPLALSAHMSIEALPMLQLAINEMLLQSYSGTIRVFPAVPDDWEGQFRLHAVGRFVVSAARSQGQATYVVIESRGSEPCRLSNPWRDEAASLYRQEDGWSRVQALEGKILTFATEPDGLYLLLPHSRTPESLRPVEITATPNQGPKTLGQARLGLPKGF